MIRYAILAEGFFDMEWAKTAACVIRYCPDQVAAVLDSTQAGRNVAEILGFGEGIPVLAGIADALKLDPPPNALLLGIAPQGGRLPGEWREWIRHSIRSGLDIWSGLHSFLEDDPEFADLAATHGVTLHDVRRPPTDLPVGTGLAMDTDALRVLTVGTDCNVGKMTAGMEIVRELRGRSLVAELAPTGQTGIFIEGRGIAVDAVVSDFVAGASERLVMDLAPGADVVVVEGQGSLLHPGYSGVTLGLMHGSLPQAMVLCTKPQRRNIYGGSYDWVEIPPLDKVVRLHEEAMAWVCPKEPSRVVGIACNTHGQREEDAREEIDRAEALTGLPATDPIRFGSARLADAVEAALRTRR